MDVDDRLLMITKIIGKIKTGVIYIGYTPNPPLSLIHVKFSQIKILLRLS